MTKKRREFGRNFFLQNSTMQRKPEDQRQWSAFIQEFAQTHDKGTFTPTLTGWSSGPSGPSCTWKREGNIVHFHWGVVAFGTSNTTTIFINNVPAEITPSAKVWTTWAGPASDASGTVYHAGTVEIDVDNTMQFWPGFDDTGWTASGSKGWALAGDECYFSYNLFDTL